MPLDRTYIEAVSPRTAAQRGDFAAALSALGQAVTGGSAYLAAGRFALAGAPDLPVVDAAGAAQTETEGVDDDGVLGAMGLRLLHVPGARMVSTPNASLAALDLRIGLLQLMLQTAHDHLKPRRSFGQKTLHHQLVKADFGDASGAIILLDSKCSYRRATGDMAGLAEDHATLSAAEVQAEKLMGGHGYLAGGTHQIGYLSMLLRGLFGGAPT